MKSVFVDTVYWIARANPKDSWRGSAQRAYNRLPAGAGLVTTDEVLTEFLTSFSRDRSMREQAAEFVREVMADRRVEVVPQTRDSFLKGLDRYEARLDKGYSMQDCISMSVMESMSITDVLTLDGHFTQEGFNILMERPSKSGRGGPSSASKKAS